MGTFHPVHAVGLAAGVAAAAGLALVLLRRVLLRRRALPGSIVRLAQAIPEALGDAVLAIDRAGRVAFANTAAARLVGVPVAELVDRDVADVAPELAALARGLERGPAAARIVLSNPAGPVVVHAALVRVLARPALALAVLRRLPPPSPPPLPRASPDHARADGAAARAALAAAAEALHDPVADAADAMSMLRLSVTRLATGADAALCAAEDAVGAVARRLAALEAAGEPGGVRGPVDLAALVEDLVATFPAPPGVRVHLDRAASCAVADDRPVRAAVRELLGAAAASLPAGGDVAVAVQGGRMAIVEVRTPARISSGGLALARALVAPQGGRVEDEPVPGRGWVVRIALVGAAALEPA